MRKTINVTILILVSICMYFLLFKPDWVVAGPQVHQSTGNIGTDEKQSEIEAHNKPFENPIENQTDVRNLYHSPPLSFGK